MHAAGAPLGRGQEGHGRCRGADRLPALYLPGSATTVRVRDGERLLTDGPAAEIKEQCGGYTLIGARTSMRR